MRAFASTQAFPSTSSDQFCCASSEHFRNYKLRAGQQAVSYWEWLNRDEALSCCLALCMLSCFVKPCLQASKFPLKRVKDSPPLQVKCFRYRITLLPGTELRAISFNKRQQNEEGAFPETFMAHACFPDSDSQFPIRETLFPVSVFVFKIQIMLTFIRYTAGNFKENPSMRTLARASEHPSNFC